jgi:hypothetical protein
LHDAPSDQPSLVLNSSILTELDIAAPSDAPAPARRLAPPVDEATEIAERAAEKPPLYLRLATIAAVVLPPMWMGMPWAR